MLHRALLIGTLVLGIVAAPAAAAVDYEVKGRWTCRDGTTVAPIAGARVELYRSRSWWPDERMRVAHTAADGSFDFFVRADSNSTFYVNLELIGGGVDLENWYSPFNWSTESGKRKRPSGLVDLGTWEVARSGGASGSPKCQIWQGAHDAYVDFRAVVGARPPTGDYGIEADFPCCGVPFTTTDTTRWPAGYPTGARNSTSFHEFAHAMRHSFDGGFAHFLVDAGRFQYPQFHSSCKDTNQGFAFNEGWAEYWARSFETCGDGTNLSQEGNVAAALTGLEGCSSRPQMVRVLRETPTGITLSTGIHSFGDFRARFFQLYGQQVCGSPRVGAAVTDAVISRARIVRDIRGQISAQRSLIGRLARQERQATGDARGIEPCRGAGCQAAMERVIAPSALDAQGHQADLVLTRLRRGLAAARKARLRTFHSSGFVDTLARGRRRFTLANETIVIGGLRRAIEAIRERPAIKGEGSTGLFRTLTRRLAAVTRARRSGRQLAAGLRALFAPPVPPLERVRRVPQESAPPEPAPPPTIEPTTLSQTCPPVVNTATGTPFTVTGTLAPAPPAASIRLVYTPPGGTPFARTTSADASGSWSHTIDPSADHGDGNTYGNWIVQSRFDGAPGFQPSQSNTCTVNVTD
ncbi:MAG TPA: hypothetical protein VFM57_12460 [Thermoleophilaceae bacterium]|nr:hypothetical protein [Thermoleophilaceae bacterium]